VLLVVDSGWPSVGGGEDRRAGRNWGMGCSSPEMELGLLCSATWLALLLVASACMVGGGRGKMKMEGINA
jgi:hypothetical protein